MFNLSDKDVSLTSAFSLILWLIGACLILLAALTECRTGDLGLLIAGWGAVLTIRGYICSGVERVVEREEAAFQMGRDSIRSLR